MRGLTAFVAGLLALPLGGCGDAASKLVPVSGSVTMDGKPLPGAVVTFTPTGTTPGVGGSGLTGQDGAFVLAEGRRAARGVPPGDYKVVITRLLKPDGSPVPADAKPIEAGGNESLPPEYSDPLKTTLKATVRVRGGTFEFPLKEAAGGT
jgi:hypothetical protein